MINDNRRYEPSTKTAFSITNNVINNFIRSINYLQHFGIYYVG